MKKPTEAIERMRGFYGSGHLWDDSVKIVLSYLDSIPEWPADLTRERLAERDAEIAALKGHAEAMADELARQYGSYENKLSEALPAYRAAYPKEADK